MDDSITALLGKTLTRVNMNDRQDVITFEASDGSEYSMFHSQDCCENVSIEDINGDLQGLVGSPILVAEESSSNVTPEDLAGKEGSYEPESQTWTFYKLANINGHVDIRWHGVSNGYYSESVSFEQTAPTSEPA